MLLLLQSQLFRRREVGLPSARAPPLDRVVVEHVHGRPLSIGQMTATKNMTPMPSRMSTLGLSIQVPSIPNSILRAGGSARPKGRDVVASKSARFKRHAKWIGHHIGSKNLSGGRRIKILHCTLKYLRIVMSPPKDLITWATKKSSNTV